MNAAAAGSCTRALAFRLTAAGAAAEAETSEVDRALSWGSFAYDVGKNIKILELEPFPLVVKFTQPPILYSYYWGASASVL